MFLPFKSVTTGKVRKKQSYKIQKVLSFPRFKPRSVTSVVKLRSLPHCMKRHSNPFHAYHKCSFNIRVMWHRFCIIISIVSTYLHICTVIVNDFLHPLYAIVCVAKRQPWPLWMLKLYNLRGSPVSKIRLCTSVDIV